ncbi:MAG: FG-GAP-like repeat-containing protein [Candidatus Njordarchaeia archaeon]
MQKNREITQTKKNKKPEWTYKTGDHVYSSPALGDIDGDGKLEVVIGSEDHKVYALNGEDGSMLWNYTTGGCVYSSPALGDVDGDGKLEVVVGSADHNVYVFNGEDGSILWAYTAGNAVFSSPALGDIDGDGKLEIVIGSFGRNVYVPSGEVYVFNGENGSMLWNYTTGGYVSSSPALGDVDGDGKLEVVVGSADHNVYVFNGEDGSVLWVYTTGSWVSSSPALGDVDGDGKLEVVVGSYDYNVYVFGFSGLVARWDVIWQGLRGTFLGDKNFLNCDYDMDGLSNTWETSHGLNPVNPDADGDGFYDGWEVAQGTDPLNPLDNLSLRFLYPVMLALVIVFSAIWFRYRYLTARRRGRGG